MTFTSKFKEILMSAGWPISKFVKTRSLLQTQTGGGCQKGVSVREKQNRIDKERGTSLTRNLSLGLTFAQAGAGNT